jgi:tetrahydromethanopterin S-methyltransferase subunit A
MNLIEEIAGELCKILLPIEEKIFFGNSKSGIALCTLSSIRLLREVASSSLMKEISVAGRLLSENKGIDSLVRYVISNTRIDTIILCGEDTVGHRSGHSLICLHTNGVGKGGTIIASQSPQPVVSLTKQEVTRFQNQVKIVNKIGETRISKLQAIIETKNQS